MLEEKNTTSDLKLSLVNVFGGLIFGYNSGVIAGVLALPDFKSQTPLDNSLLTCSLLVGAMIGSLLSSWAMNKLGRKKPMIILSILCIIGAVGSALVPQKLWYINIFRFVLGLSIGMCSIICPTYVNEMASEEKKSKIGTFFQIAITVGIFISDVIGFALKDIHYNYRVMFGLGLIPGVLLLFLAPTLSESKKWFDFKYKAINDYDDLHMRSVDERSGGIREIFSSKMGRFAMFIGVVLAVNNQLTGINAFMYFSPSIFEKAGITSTNGSMLATIALVGWNAITTVIATVFIDKIGKKKLMIWGSLIMVISCISLAILFLFLDGMALGVLSIVLLFAFILGFESSAGPLFWLYIIELFPTDLSDTGSSLINAIQWSFNIILSFSFLQLVNLIHEAAVFFIFGGIGFICLVIMIFKLEDSTDRRDYKIIY